MLRLVVAALVLEVRLPVKEELQAPVSVVEEPVVRLVALVQEQAE